MTSDARSPLTIEALTPERWPDFEELLGEHGAYGGCWCMWWRCTRREFAMNQGEGNRLAMKAIVDKGDVPGILAYRDRRAVGWCSIAPRERLASLERSPVLRRIDDLPVWSLVCLFVDRGHRGEGIARALVRGALEYVRAHREAGGTTIVEAYPSVGDGEGRVHQLSAYMGNVGLFAAEGFEVVARPSASKAVMRRYLDRQHR